MIFEVGKFYRHPRIDLAIVGELNTTLWGYGLVAETNEGTLIRVGNTEDSAVNFVEITEAEWLKNFSK